MALLNRYIQLTAFRAYALVAAVLTAMFTLLDFVEQLAVVGQGNYHPGNALAYVLLTVPQRLVQVTPVSMLLGSLLGLAALNRSSELTAIRSIGVSEARIIWSVMKLTLPIAIGLFLLAELAIPPAQRLAQEERSAALAPTHEDQSFWAQGNSQYLNVQSFPGKGVLKDVDIFSFDHDGALASFIHGDRANIRPDGTWLLTDVVRKGVQSSLFHTEHLASLSWSPFISASQIQLLRLPLESMPPVELYRYIVTLKRQHQPVSRYQLELWTKIGIPVSMAALVMIVAPFVFGQIRARNSGYQLVVGAAIGIVFSLTQQITHHAGALLGVAPAVSALAPSLLLMALAAYLFLRVHE
jgi:lipopolysaccharide export system permease protein